MENQYVGARYVPNIYTNPDDGSADWKENATYEALTIVTYNGDSYTSKKAVPNNIGNPADNKQYWVKTGDFNASLIALQNRVTGVENKIGTGALDTLSQVITGAINELHANSEKTFVNVADMIADATLKAGMIVCTSGYYAVNDGGGCDYIITDENTPLAIEVGTLYAMPVMDIINVKKLGAKGDGSECADIIQKALDNANGKTVFIPIGEYTINRPLYLYFGKLVGEDYTKTIIKASENYYNNNRYTVTSNVKGMLFVLNADYVSGDESNDSVSGVEIKEIELHCNSVCDYGIVFSLKTSRTLVERVMVRYSNVSAFIGHQNMWLCKFVQCYAYYSEVAFDFLEAVKTSLYFDQCYAMSADTGYAIKSDYSCLINCCADGITNIAYDLEEFKGTLVGCGCESTNALYVVKAWYSNVDISNSTLFAPTKANSAVIFINGGSYINANGRIYGDSTACKLYKMSGYDNNLIFNNFFVPSNILGAELNIEPSNHVIYLEDDLYSSRGNISPFLGFDAQNHDVKDANAIFMGNTSAPFKMSNNRNYAASWNKRCNVGDLFLTKIPRDINAAGWMCCYDGSDNFSFVGTVAGTYGNSLLLTAGGINGEFNAGAKVPNGATLYTESGIVGTVSYSTSPTEIVMSAEPVNITAGDTVYISKLENNGLSDLYVSIPVIMFGNTSYRPAHPVAGSSYFDTQLVKPIWWTGSKWVDATGTQV